MTAFAIYGVEACFQSQVGEASSYIVASSTLFRSSAFLRFISAFSLSKDSAACSCHIQAIHCERQQPVRKTDQLTPDGFPRPSRNGLLAHQGRPYRHDVESLPPAKSRVKLYLKAPLLGQEGNAQSP